MATTSRVPAAVDALLAILGAAPGLDGVLVLDGPPWTNLTGTERIYVGWQPSEAPAVSLTQDFSAAGARTRDEEFTIHCYAEAWSGSTDMQPRRARAFELVAVVEQALRATDTAPEAPTLNGTVLWAHITSGDLAQDQTTEGARAGIPFAVSCRARI
ncbi:hypothetical protein [Streptomyces sp. NPDC055607]